MYKIQIRAIERDGEKVSLENKMWQDCINIPELKTMSDVGDWLAEKELTVLESLGFQFRVIPMESK